MRLVIVAGVVAVPLVQAHLARNHGFRSLQHPACLGRLTQRLWIPAARPVMSSHPVRGTFFAAVHAYGHRALDFALPLREPHCVIFVLEMASLLQRPEFLLDLGA